MEEQVLVVKSVRRYTIGYEVRTELVQYLSGLVNEVKRAYDSKTGELIGTPKEAYQKYNKEKK
jgi:hypothetical protein